MASDPNDPRSGPARVRPIAMDLDHVDPSVIGQAAEFLSQDKLVVIPTETVYGLAAAATSKPATAKIFAAKGRPPSNPLIVHVASVQRLGDAADADRLGALQSQLAVVADLWPGPLTIVLPVGRQIPTTVTAGGTTVAVRIPDHPVALALLAECPFPIAAPSANRSKYVSPTLAMHCVDTLGEDVAMILDGGPCRWGVESTILSLDPTGPRLLRPGVITAETLADRFGVSVDHLCQDLPPVTEGKPLLAPGMMREHYSPRTTLRLIDPASDPISPERTNLRRGRIAFQPLAPERASGYEVVETLSPSGDLEQVSHHLFAAIRRLDQLGLDEIHVDTCPPTRLGRAIMDRLMRAAAGHRR